MFKLAACLKRSCTLINVSLVTCFSKEFDSTQSIALTLFAFTALFL